MVVATWIKPFFSYPFLYPFCVLFCIIYCEITLMLACPLTFILIQSHRTLKKKVMLCWRVSCGWNNGSSTLNPLDWHLFLSQSPLWLKSSPQMHLLSSCYLAGGERLSLKWHLACPTVKTMTTSHERSSHMEHSQVMMEIRFSMRQFSGKTFSEVVPPNLRMPGDQQPGEVTCVIGFNSVFTVMQ